MESETITQSLNPGIREYYVPQQSLQRLGLPVCCFASMSLILIVIGACMYAWSKQLHSEYNLPFRTFGSAFLSLGVFVAVISVVLASEALISGQCRTCPGTSSPIDDRTRLTGSSGDISTISLDLSVGSEESVESKICPNCRKEVTFHRMPDGVPEITITCETPESMDRSGSSLSYLSVSSSVRSGRGSVASSVGRR